MDKQFDVLVQYIIEVIKQKVGKKTPDGQLLRKELDRLTLRKNLDIEIAGDSLHSEDMVALIEKIIDHSVVTDHPYFMNQMFGKTQPISFLADILLSVINTSMYTFEVAPVMSLIENEVIRKLGAKIWGEGIGDGVFTAGGSMSNMKALFLARQRHLQRIKRQGLSNEKHFSIIISEQTHYSFVKGVKFMGFGSESLLKVSCNDDATINTDEAEKLIVESKQKGSIPMILVGIAGTTISGSYDDLETLALIAKKYNMWFHVDASYGGSFLFSDREKVRLKGIDKADSVSWNFHKIIGMTLSTASFLTKEKGLLNQAFNVDAEYLFHENKDSYDLGQKSLQGGRRPDAFKLWMSWKYNGDKAFAQHVEKLYDAAKTMAKIIEQNPNTELFHPPQSTIVCFRYLPDDTSFPETNALNKQIREYIFKEGKIIFNYASLNNKVYLRCVLLDPDITEKQLQHIVTTVVNVGNRISISKSTDLNPYEI